jgi:polyisoprenoid-binding protein YceI
MKLIQRLCLGTAVVALAGSGFAADVYQVDPAHTSVGFSITHMVINTVHGRFGDVAGSVSVDPDASNALVEAQATIQAKSVDTGIEKRDNHLRSLISLMSPSIRPSPSSASAWTSKVARRCW